MVLPSGRTPSWARPPWRGTTSPPTVSPSVFRRASSRPAHPEPMAVLAIVTSSPAAVEGGHLTIARALVAAAAENGHTAHLVVTPDYGFGRQTASYWAAWKTDVRQIAGAPVDQVISFRHPSYAVQHPAHVCWLNHTMREYYDLWPQFVASISPRNRIKETLRRTLTHAADRWLLRGNVSRV